MFKDDVWLNLEFLSLSQKVLLAKPEKDLKKSYEGDLQCVNILELEMSL